MYKILTGLLIGLVVAGCAADPVKVQSVGKAEAQLLDPPTNPLSTFSHFELMPMAYSEGIRQRPEKLAEGQEFERNLADKIGPLLKTWEASNQGSAGTLTIQPELETLRIVSGGARFWVGAFAGDSHIDMRLRLIDATTGEQIANPRINMDSGGLAGAWSIGKSDQNLDEYLVSVVYEYLVGAY
jgi:hypothetical protein